jgi:hypothetical protein
MVGIVQKQRYSLWGQRASTMAAATAAIVDSETVMYYSLRSRTAMTRPKRKAFTASSGSCKRDPDPFLLSRDRSVCPYGAEFFSDAPPRGDLSHKGLCSFHGESRAIHYLRYPRV